MYTKKQIKFKYAIEVMEYHSGKYGAPGEKRQKKRKPTPEDMERVNQWNRERKARWKLREHFKVNDYFTDLTYRKDERPDDMVMAKKHFSEFLKLVRREYKKRGHELKWIRNIEVGTKNGWHIHVIVNRIPDTDIILRNAWKFGKVISELLYEKGEFRKLAAYITKTPKTDPRLRETHYSASRNLPLREPEKKEYLHWKTWRKIKIPDGYYLDEESFYEGENPKNGYKCRVYTLLKIRGKEPWNSG